MALQSPHNSVNDWVADSDASHHTTHSVDNISNPHPLNSSSPSSIVVGNGSTLPVTSVGDSVISGPFYLNNILLAPDIVQNLLSVRRGSDTVYLLLYVVDIILTTSRTELLRHTISALQREFTMDLGPLHHFLDITVEHRPDGLFLHQRTYMLDILKRAIMVDYMQCTTLVDIQAKLAGDSRPPVEDASQFQSIAGALHYLTFTRPDFTYAVQQICLHMHDPWEPHLMAMKRIPRYLQATPDYDLLLRHSSSSDLIVYTDADWAGCPDTRHSTSAYAVFLGDNLIS
jgi:hypothetical protein